MLFSPSDAEAYLGEDDTRSEIRLYGSDGSFGGPVFNPYLPGKAVMVTPELLLITFPAPGTPGVITVSLQPLDISAFRERVGLGGGE